MRAGVSTKTEKSSFLYLYSHLKYQLVNIQKTDILPLLQDVVDPVTGSSIVTTQRVRQIEVDGSEVRIVLSYTDQLTQEQKSTVNFAILAAVQSKYPTAVVHTHLETQIREGDTKIGALPHVKHFVAVASGKGGVGKSTVSSNLALSLKDQGYKVGLIDADLYGPSIPTMFGLEGQKPKLQEFQGKGRIVPLMAHGIYLMSIGFIVAPEQAVVLRGPRLAGVMQQFIRDCLWPELDYLIIDLPPGTGDIQLTLVQTLPITGAVMVTTPQKVARIDAIKAMNMFRLDSVNVPILGVIENMSWFTPEELPQKKYYLFGKGGGDLLAKEAGTALLGQVPIVESIREAGDTGIPSVIGSDQGQVKIWMDIGSSLVNAVNDRMKNRPTTRIVDIKE